MPLLRAQAIHKHKDGLPRDHYVNTFHFEVPDVTVATAEAVAEDVRDFFNVTQVDMASPLSSHFGGTVALVGHEIRMYPVDIATGVDTRGLGQAPLWIENYDHLGRGAPVQANMPSEVALCLSYKNLEGGIVPPARKRGRIYFGPVGIGETADEAVTDIARPDPALRQELLDAGKWLADRANRAGSWVIYSRPFEGRPAITAQARKDAGGPFRELPAIPARNGAIFDVTDLWCDNAWDTQRRRGEAASSRLTAVA